MYASEADVLNVALFGMTAKEWKEQNPELTKTGNIRDYTDLLNLIILNNLENTNAELIRMNIKQSDRLIQLNESARIQMEALKTNNYRLTKLSVHDLKEVKQPQFFFDLNFVFSYKRNDILLFLHNRLERFFLFCSS